MSIQTAEEQIAKNMPLYLEKVAPFNINLFSACKAIIRIESDFNPKEIMDEKNVKDFSIGYMQLRIETTRWQMGWWLKPAAEIKSMLFDPEFNIKVGIRYFVKQILRYKGDMRKAVCAYNAGSYIEKNGVCINEGYFKKWKKYYEEYAGVREWTVIP